MNVFKIIFLLLFIFSLLASCKQKVDTPAVRSAAEPSVAAPEWAKNANIYEVNIRQYTPEGTLNAFTAHLPRLKEMGVDVLWLMPIFPISEKNRKGSLGSYYAVSDFTKVNPNFGTMDDFKTLLQQAHDLGMKIILDWVPNHTGWDHVWIKNHPEYYTQNDKGEIIDPVNPETGESWGWSDVADLNYDNSGLRQAMISDMLFWINDIGIDGFRCDVAGEVPTDFWQEATAQLRSAKPDIFMLAEAEKPELRNQELFVMDYSWSFHHLMNDIAQGKKNANDIDLWLKEDREKYEHGYHMQFITNHDENSWNGTEFERMGEATDAMAVLAFTFEGMPLIYSGQESGFNRRLKFFEKDQIDWDNYAKQSFYKTLLDLKHRNQALWNGTDGGEVMRIQTDAHDKVYAFYREKNNDKVVVILNLSADTQITTLNDERIIGDFSNVFGNSTTSITKGMTIQLSPWGYVVLSNK